MEKPELFICDRAKARCDACAHAKPHVAFWQSMLHDNCAGEINKCYGIGKKVRCIPYKEVKP
jgi:hypothetical protein